MNREGRVPSAYPVLFVLLFTVALGSLQTPALVQASQTRLNPSIPVGPGMSSNWAGYVVASGRSPAPVVTAVYGSWVVEAVQPSSIPEAAAQWAGIGGFFNGDTTIIQAGAESSSSSGTTSYVAWWATYPNGQNTLPNTVAPGDLMQVSVVCVLSCNSETQTWKITITDSTEGWTFAKSVVYASDLRSAEWIEERPTTCVLSKCTLMPLADFGSAYYGQDYTSMQHTEYATIAGVTLPVGLLPNTQVAMLPSVGAPVTAQPSALSSDGTSFIVVQP